MKLLTDTRWFPRVATDKDLGRPDRRLALTDEQPFTVCAECHELIEYKRTAEDTFVWCESCQLAEGDTITVEPDDCDCDMGYDGCTPSICRACRIRNRVL